MKVCWPPKLSRSAVHGVVYRCHCIPVSVYQLLCNVREGCKVLLFVWVVGHKRFSCLMLLLLKGERRASVVPVRPPQITAMFLCLMFCFYLFIESALSEAKASVLGEPPDVFSYFTFSSKDLPSTCLRSSHFWKQCQQNNLWKQTLDSKEGIKRFSNSYCLLFVCLF